MGIADSRKRRAQINAVIDTVGFLLFTVSIVLIAYWVSGHGPCGT